MEKTFNVIMNAVKEHNATASKDQKKMLAMYLAYNIIIGSCDNHFECVGMLNTINHEMHAEYSEKKEKSFVEALLNN